MRVSERERGERRASERACNQQRSSRLHEWQRTPREVSHRSRGNRDLSPRTVAEVKYRDASSLPVGKESAYMCELACVCCGVGSSTRDAAVSNA